MITAYRQRLTLKASQHEFNLYLYKPTLLHPLLFNFEPMPFIRRMRYFRNYLRPGKYVVYYLETGEELVGMCVVTPGGAGIKIKCAGINDIILGPYYIKRCERGKGYSKTMIEWVLRVHPCYHYAYVLIADNNTASQRASLSCGFMVFQEICICGPLRRHKICKGNSTHKIYRYKR